MNNIIKIGTVYNLNEKYREAYRLAIITYNIYDRQIIVNLISAWNSTYDQIIKIKCDDITNIINEYQG